MPRWRRILLIIGGAVGVLAIATAAFILLLPNFIDVEAFKGRIVDSLSRKVKGKVDVHAVELAYRPSLHLIMRDVAITIPEEAVIHARSLTAFPKILPLLTGKVQIERLVLDSAVIALKLPERSTSLQGNVPSYETFHRHVESAIARQTSKSPNLEVALTSARVELFRSFSDKEPAFWFEGVKADAVLQPGAPRLTLSSAKSNLAENVKLRADYGQSNKGLAGDVEFVKLQPDKIAEIYFPSMTPGSAASLANASLAFTADSNALTVVIHSAALTPEYYQLPAALLLKGGKIVWHGTTVSLDDAAGGMGDSYFSKVNGWTSWGDQPSFAISSGPARIVLDGVYPWLLSHEELRKALSSVQSATGIVTVDSLHIEGPPSKPAAWNFNADGGVEKVTLDSDELPKPLVLESGKFRVDGEGSTVSFLGVSGSLGSSTFGHVSSQVTWGGQPRLDVTSATARLTAGEIYTWIASHKGAAGLTRQITSMEGIVTIDSLQIAGPLERPEKWHYNAAGDLEDFQIDARFLPGRMVVRSGGFEAVPETISMRDWNAALLGSAVVASGSLDGYRREVDKVDLSLHGKIDLEAARWISSLVKAPAVLKLAQPMEAQPAHLVWVRHGGTDFTGTLTLDSGPLVSVDLTATPEAVLVKKLQVRDKTSSAFLTVEVRGNLVDLTFDGTLTAATFNKLMRRSPYFVGWGVGKFHARIPLRTPMNTVAVGSLYVEGVTLPVKLRPPIFIETASLSATEANVYVGSSLLRWLDNKEMSFTGEVALAEGLVYLDADLFANGLTMREISSIQPGGGARRGPRRSGGGMDLPLRGALRVRTGHFTYGAYTWRSADAEVRFLADRIEIAASRANLCAIATPGTVIVTPRQYGFSFQYSAADLPVEETFRCVWGKERLMTGTFNLEGHLATQGKGEALLRSLQGDMDFYAYGGRIHRLNVLSKIFALLNVTEVFRGKLPDLEEEGFGYHSATVKGVFQGNAFKIEEALIDGDSMDIAAHGNVFLDTRTLDLTVMVAPLKTVNAIVSRIPLVGHILGGSLVTIPVKVTGDISDPTVVPLSPGAVGSEVLGILKRTITLPFHIIQPLLPGK